MTAAYRGLPRRRAQVAIVQPTVTPVPSPSDASGERDPVARLAARREPLRDIDDMQGPPQTWAPTAEVAKRRAEHTSSPTSATATNLPEQQVARLAARRATGSADPGTPWAPSPEVVEKRRAYLEQQQAAEPEPLNPVEAVDRLTARREVQ